MKNGILAVITLGAFVVAPALAAEVKLKKADVPAAVLKTVSEKYPGAEMTGFDRETENGKTDYEIDLKVDGSRMEVAVDADGNLLSEEKRINESELPVAVKNGLSSSKYAKSKIVRVEKVTEGEAAAVYEIVVRDGKRRRELTFTESGGLSKDEKPDEMD